MQADWTLRGRRRLAVRLKVDCKLVGAPDVGQSVDLVQSDFQGHARTQRGHQFQ